MADAEDSKSSVGNHVRVQVPLSAPLKNVRQIKGLSANPIIVQLVNLTHFGVDSRSFARSSNGDGANLNFAS